jgi:hypothetical protein
LAIYSLRVQTIGRSEGRSVLAAAAYRSGSSLADKRLGMDFDFSGRREGVAHIEIIAPENSPREFLDREVLWNAADAADRRKDSVPAREILVALPHELNDEQRRELVREFARGSLVGRGMIADIAIHRPGGEGDDRNHHAHILVTTRNVDPSGFTSKNPDWNAREFVVEVRREWAEVQNKYLERHAPSAAKVSEKSLAEQGVDREPTQHMGPDVTAMEHRGERTDRGENNRDIEAQNKGGERLDRRLDKEVADAWQARKWVQRPTDDVIKEMEVTRAAMARQRDAWQRERDGVGAPRPQPIRTLEADLTRKEAAAYRQALEDEQRVKALARSNGLSAKRIAQWHTNPSGALMKSLVSWHADLDRVAGARRQTERARRELNERRAWTKSEQGRAHIQNLRQGDIDAANAAKTQQRTLDRKIRRMGKRIEDADKDILRTKVVKRLGHERLRVPADLPTAAGRGGANARRYFRFMAAEARVAYGKAPEPDVKDALKFLRGLAPGAPVPSARPASSGPTPNPSFAPDGASKTPDLPDV